SGGAEFKLVDTRGSEDGVGVGIDETGKDHTGPSVDDRTTIGKPGLQCRPGTGRNDLSFANEQCPVGHNRELPQLFVYARPSRTREREDLAAVGYGKRFVAGVHSFILDYASPVRRAI